MCILLDFLGLLQNDICFFVNGLGLFNLPFIRLDFCIWNNVLCKDNNSIQGSEKHLAIWKARLCHPLVWFVLVRQRTLRYKRAARVKIIIIIKKSNRAILFKLHSPFALLRKQTVPKFSVSKLRQRKPKQYIQWLAKRDLRNSITQVNSMCVVYGVMLLAKSRPNIHVCGHQLVKWGNKKCAGGPPFFPQLQQATLFPSKKESC